MTDVPATVPDNDDLAKATLQRIQRAEKRHEKRIRRMSSISLFEDLTYVPYKGAGQRIKKRATIQGGDTPDIQMMIARRDRYEACLRHVARLEQALREATDPGEIAKLAQAVGTFEKLADNHAHAIEAALATTSKETQSVHNVRSRLLTSAAKMSQDDRHHAEKMAAAKATDPNAMSEAELIRIMDADQAATPDADA